MRVRRIGYNPFTDRARGFSAPSPIQAWFFGICEPPAGGHAAYGVQVFVEDTLVLKEGKLVGVGQGMSPNTAAYRGVIACLRCIQQNTGRATIRGDCKLVVEQLNGRWCARSGAYLPHYEKAKVLWDGLKNRCKLIWIPYADEACELLATQALKDIGVEIPSPWDDTEPRSYTPL